MSLLGDELRYATNNASRVFSVAGKDRGAILMAGKTGTAYMYSTKTGRFTSTSYYMDKHPQWWGGLLRQGAAEQVVSPSAGMCCWTTRRPMSARCRKARRPRFTNQMTSKMGYLYGIGETSPGASYYRMLMPSPFGDEMTADFALTMMKSEAIGRNPKGRHRHHDGELFQPRLHQSITTLVPKASSRWITCCGSTAHWQSFRGGGSARQARQRAHRVLGRPRFHEHTEAVAVVSKRVALTRAIPATR